MTLKEKIKKFVEMGAKVKNGKKMTKKEVIDEKKKKLEKMRTEFYLK